VFQHHNIRVGLLPVLIVVILVDQQQPKQALPPNVQNNILDKLYSMKQNVTKPSAQWPIGYSLPTLG